LITYRLY